MSLKFNLRLVTSSPTEIICRSRREKAPTASVETVPLNLQEIFETPHVVSYEVFGGSRGGGETLILILHFHLMGGRFRLLTSGCRSFP